MFQDLPCADCQQPIKYAFIVLLCDACLAAATMKAKKLRRGTSTMEMNNDPKWLKKMAEEEAKVPGGVYVPLTIACPACKGVTKADDWPISPLAKMACCPICRAWLSIGEITS